MAEKSYEDAMQELQQIIEELKNGGVGIDQLTEKVKAGAELIHFCKAKLRNTKKMVDDLLQDE